eukprot:SAG11_NODE_979_length_6319_cov_2.950322_5_plen_85_part_00
MLKVGAFAALLVLTSRPCGGADGTPLDFDGHTLRLTQDTPPRVAVRDVVALMCRVRSRPFHSAPCHHGSSASSLARFRGLSGLC